MGKTNILITSAGRRVSLIQAFKKEIEKAKLTIKVFATDLAPQLSSACQIADASFKVERVTAPTYIDNLIKICLKNHIKIIIPTIDTELLILANNKDKLLSHGIKPVISDLDIIKKCRDKRLIHSFFDEMNFKRANEIDYNDPNNYPVFVKPYDGSRSQGIKLLNTIDDLSIEVRQNSKNMFLEYFDPNEHDEFTVDIYFNQNSKIIAVIPRQRIFVRDGEVNKACTRKNNIIDFVLEKMDGLNGFRGCITLQVFYHKNENSIIGIEINPRFGGGFPLTYLSGSNFPLWIIKEYVLNESVIDYNDNWEDNLLMLRYDAEILVSNYN